MNKSNDTSFEPITVINIIEINWKMYAIVYAIVAYFIPILLVIKLLSANKLNYKKMLFINGNLHFKKHDIRFTRIVIYISYFWLIAAFIDILCIVLVRLIIDIPWDTLQVLFISIAYFIRQLSFFLLYLSVPIEYVIIFMIERRFLFKISQWDLNQWKDLIQATTQLPRY